jgi:hypothetical protein
MQLVSLQLSPSGQAMPLKRLVVVNTMTGVETSCVVVGVGSVQVVMVRQSCQEALLMVCHMRHVCGCLVEVRNMHARGKICLCRVSEEAYQRLRQLQHGL